MKKLIIVSLVCLGFCSLLNEAVSQSLEQRKTNLNKGWLYLEEDTRDAAQLKAPQYWQEIDLPHTWNNMDATDLAPGYRRSASWYRKLLDMKPDRDKRYFLYFEGASISTEVYVNGKRAGGHVGGYVGFEVELTPFLQEGANELLVRVDNAYNREIIPSQKSDFFIFGGITRDVWLKTVPLAFLDRIVVTTPEVSRQSADSEFEVTIDHVNSASTKGYSLKCEVTAPGGDIVFREEKKLSGFDPVNFRFHNLDNPKLWDVNDPNLYNVTVTLLHHNKPIDRLTERYGYRWFEFKDYGAFYLNGVRLLLRGTHRHEEHAGYGAAMPNALHIRDMEMIKGIGANFVRLGHYPQDPEVYKACDELGIIVWDELPWCRGGVGNEAWKENTRRLLKEMIAQNRNHPSVVFWSLGNEINWLPDFEGGDNTERINVFLRELNELAHQLDPSRFTSIRKYYEGADIVDVFSPSIWSGWYSGNYKNYEQALEKSKKAYKHFIHAEYGGDSHIGRHSENPIDGEGVINPDGWEEPVVQVQVKNIAQYGDWSENYIVDLFDWHLRVSETFSDFAGNAQWAFKDFATPLRPENPIPYMNQKGLVDREGKPKDAYYVFKSYWSEAPFCYIESHTWTERSGPPDLARNISVFSSCEQVTLFHEGVDLGTKDKDIDKFPACGLNWDVHFREGSNTLVAVGYHAGKQVAADTLLVNYTYQKHSTPKELKLSSRQLPGGNLLIEAVAVDRDGKRCLDYEERVYFQCLSGGKTLANLGTPTGSEVIAMANGRAAIEVVPDPEAEKVVMTVLNQSFKGSFLEVKVNEGVQVNP